MRSLMLVLAMSAPAVAAPTSIQMLRQPVETVSAARASSRTIYLNRDGGMLRPGPNNSRQGTSTLVQQQVSVGAWNPTEQVWSEVVACMHEIWAPFDVTITDEDPGSAPHIEAMFTPSSAALGLPANVGGIAPMSTTCSVVENNIVFTFTDNVRNPRRICEVMSQEIGHAYGLDHELAADDPMTYLSFSGERAFQDRDVACGESSERPCGITSHVCWPTQNSFRILRERLGEPGADNDAPDVTVHSPVDRAEVARTFTVSATAHDVSGASATLEVDGVVVGARAESPYEWTVTAEPGEHVLAIEVIDARGNAVVHEISVSVADVDDEEAPEIGFPVGCSAGGAPGLALAALALLLRRRRATSRA